MKRIISALLIFAMVFATSSLVSANDTTGAVTVLTSYDGSSPGESTGSIEFDSTSIIRKNIGGTFTGVDENNDGTYDYIKNSNTSSKTNYRTSLLAYIENTPVFSFKYDINIPNDANVDAKRSFKPVISATDTNTASSTNPTNITIDYSTKEFSINATKAGFETSDSKTVSYTPGSWVTVEFRAYRGNDGKLICGAYVGDAQIFYGEGNVDYSSKFALNNFTFTQDANISTYMDNIIISTMGESYKPTTIPEEVPDVPEVPDEPETPEIVAKNITKFDGSLLKDNKGTAFETNEIPLKPTSANISMYSLSDCEFVKQFLVKSGCYGTGVSNAVEDDNTYYVINWSDVQSNYRKSVKEYMTSDTPVLSYSYDMKVPTASSDMERITIIKLTSVANTSTDLTEIQIGYDDGDFYVACPYGINTVNSKNIPYNVGDWITFDIRAYLTDENKINVGVYANGNQVYYGEGTINYATDFCINMIRMTSETVEDEEVTCDTYYDDMDVSVLPAKYIPTQMLSLSLADDNAKVEAKATVNGSYESLCLVTAVYNTSGSMEKLFVDTTVEDGVLSNVISGTDYTTYVKSGYKVKTFIFDSLTSAIPQMEHKEITIN